MKTTDDLLTGADIARRLGISKQRVHQLRQEDSGFPRPAVAVGRIRLWRWPEVERWARAKGRTV